jgi:hypothetical protein
MSLAVFLLVLAVDLKRNRRGERELRAMIRELGKTEQ